MKVTLTQKSLAAALDTARRVVKKPPLPILANVRLDASSSSIAIRATDLDREIALSVDAEVTAEGATTVPALLLFDIVRKLSAGAEVTLAVDGEGREMTISSGRSRFRLQCLPAGDFPDIRRTEPTHSFTLTGDEVRSLLGRTAFAISKEETRFYLGGVHLHIHDDAGTDSHLLVAVATDGHRLAKVEMNSPKGALGMPGVIVPEATVEEIVKLVGKGDSEVAVSLSSEAIQFTVGETTLFSKLVDGTFPDYRRVIPAQNPHSLTVDRQAFADAVERVAVVSAERGRGLKIALDENQIVLSMSAPDAGSAMETVDAAFAGKPFEVGYNAKLLATAMAAFTCETIEFHLADPATPAVITDEYADDGLTVVLMPMRV